MIRSPLPLSGALGAILACLLSGPPSLAAQKPIVVVFDVQAKRTKLGPEILTDLSDHLATLLTQTGRYQVVPRSELKSRLQKQKKESFKQCYDESCQVELGRELAAEKTVATKIIKLGEKCRVNVTLYDLRKAATEVAASKRGQCDLDSIVLLLEQAVTELAGPPVVAEKPKKKKKRSFSDRFKTGLDTAIEASGNALTEGKKSVGHVVDKTSGNQESKPKAQAPAADQVIAQAEGGLSWLRCPLGQNWDGETCAGEAKSMTFFEARGACPAGFKLPSAEVVLSLFSNCDQATASGGSGHCAACQDSKACHAVFPKALGRTWTFSWNGEKGTVRSVGFDGSVGEDKPEERLPVHCVKN